MAVISGQDKVVELKGQIFPAPVEFGGKYGNAVISSRVTTVHKGWRAIAVNGQRLATSDLAAALTAARQQNRYTVTFRIGDLDDASKDQDLEADAELHAAEEAERARLAEEAERARQAEEEAAAAAAAAAADEEARRAAAAAAEAAETERLAAEESERRRFEEEQMRKEAEEAAKRAAEAAAEEAERRRQERHAAFEAKRRKAEEEKRRAEEKKLRAEEEKLRREQEAAELEAKRREAESAEEDRKCDAERKTVTARLEQTSGLPPRSSVADPQQALLQALCKPPPPPPSKKLGGPCDKCDGPHHEDDCPFFKGRKRCNHKDALDRYGKKGTSEDDTTAPVVLKNARIIPQPGDGSCLFHSLSYGLKSTNASKLRAEIADFIASNPDAQVSGNPIKDWVLWDTGMKVAAYASSMRTGSRWGGAVELAVCAQLKQVGIHIFEKGQKGFKQISKFGDDGQTAGRIVRLHYGGRVHYDALEV